MCIDFPLRMHTSDTQSCQNTMATDRWAHCLWSTRSVANAWMNEWIQVTHNHFQSTHGQGTMMNEGIAWGIVRGGRVGRNGFLRGQRPTCPLPGHTMCDWTIVIMHPVQRHDSEGYSSSCTHDYMLSARPVTKIYRRDCRLTGFGNNRNTAALN